MPLFIKHLFKIGQQRTGFDGDDQFGRMVVDNTLIGGHVEYKRTWQAESAFGLAVKLLGTPTPDHQGLFGTTGSQYLFGQF